ncbi:MAG: 2OG-Fe(II) oxygenase family protein [Gammaproteobacteria bacterium]|nr:2OG-Fe(II) oxygenase family protein [Gammaproteobacteria bacterium]
MNIAIEIVPVKAPKVTDSPKSWIESSDIVSMFPTYVWNMQLAQNVILSVNTRAGEVIGEMRRGMTPLAAGQSWQSAPQLHEHSGLGQLVECIESAAGSVLKFLRISNVLSVTGCWANVLATGAAHGIHNHPNNFLSGVYYLQTQTGSDSINFHDPRAQTGIIRPPVVELTAGNTDQVVVQVKNGTLLMFPSYLQHSVSPNNSDGERVSISFNMMFSSFTENLSKPLW